MMKRIESSIARILRKRADNSFEIAGAGFLVSGEHLLTCAHVITAALDIPTDTISMPTVSVFLDFPHTAAGQVLTAHVICWKAVELETLNPPEGGQDIAVLELDDPLPYAIQPVTLVRTEENDIWVWNQDFRAFGFPLGHNNGEWAVGELQGQRIDGTIQLRDKIVPGPRVQEGFSGTPVWHPELHGVVGMIVEADARAEVKTAFMIPTSLLTKAWPDLIRHITDQVSLPINRVVSFDYSCYISYPFGYQNRIIDGYVSELRDALQDEMSALGLQDAAIYYDPHRLQGDSAYNRDLARKLCRSVCMIVVFTPAYFECMGCALEYKAMEKLEEQRFALLGSTSDKKQRLIIPIIIRGQDRFPREVTQLHIDETNIFENYFPGNRYLRRRVKEAMKIKRIAQRVFDQYERFRMLPMTFNDCEEFVFPTEEEIREWHLRVRSPFQQFPLR